MVRNKVIYLVFAATVFISLLHPAASEGQKYIFLRSWPGSPVPDFKLPSGVAVDIDGNIYVSDTYNHRILKLSPDGDMLESEGIKGNREGQFDGPHGIAVNSSGVVFVADTWNSRIQAITPDGEFVILGDQGQFNEPMDVAVDGWGNLYVADTGNHRVQVFTSDGDFWTWGEYGDGFGQFDWPTGIAVDSLGLAVYVADTYNNRVQKFTSDGTFLDEWRIRWTDEGEDWLPVGIAVDGWGNVYVADLYFDSIQVFMADGTFLAELGGYGQYEGEFWEPEDVAVDDLGNIYVADTGNGRIQKFSSEGDFLIKWGTESSEDGRFYWPFDIAVGGSGDVYVTDTYNHRIQKFTLDGVFLTKWGTYGRGRGQFDEPYGVAVDNSGCVYVADTGNSRIQKFSSDGELLTEWGEWGYDDAQFDVPHGVAVDSLGYVYVADTGNDRVQKFASKGDSVAFVTEWGSGGYSGEEGFYGPKSIAVGSKGDVYVADTGNHRVQKFSPEGEFLIGWGTEGDGDGEFSWPHGIAVDHLGCVYVADTGNDRIQKFTPEGDFITKWGKWGFGDGEFSMPVGLAVDGKGNVYVVDSGGHRVQKFAPLSLPPIPDFSGEPTSGAAPLAVKFTDLSRNHPIVSYRWDFGDGGTSDLQNPSHTYARPGDYTVSLTVANSAGSDTEAKENYIHVHADPTRPVGIIEVSTNLDEATFNLYGPANYSGRGRSWIQKEVPAGEYTIEYGDVTGYKTPPPETKTLALGNVASLTADVIIKFTGEYVAAIRPSVTLNSMYGEWESGELEIEAKAADADGNVKDVLFQYSIDGDTWKDIERDAASPYFCKWDTKSALETAAGSVWVKAVATDDDGLTGEDVSASFGLDNEAPTTSHDYDGNWHSEDIVIKLTGDDGSGSGIADVSYIVNGGAVKSVSKDGDPKIDTERSDNKLEYRSIDNAGNEEEYQTLSDVKIDKIKPVLSDWTQQPEDLSVDTVAGFRIKVKATDNLSGCKTPQIAYRISSVGALNLTPLRDYSAMSDSGNGYWHFDISETWSNYPDEILYYKVRAEDNAGNAIESTEMQEKIEEITVPSLQPPTDLAAQFPELGDPRVELSWETSTNSTVIGYNIYRGESGNETGSKVNPVLVMAIIYQDNPPEKDKTYWYKVTAVNARGEESARSEAAEVFVPGPDYEIKCDQPTQSVQAGETGTFAISLVGKYGFDSTLDLSVKGLPDGANSSFDPDQLSPAVAQTSLSVGVPVQLSQGKYSFEVLAISGDKVKRVSLTLEVTSPPPKRGSAITVDASDEVQWDSKVNVSGEIFDPQDTNAKFVNIQVSLTFTPPAGQAIEEIAVTNSSGNYTFAFSDLSSESMGKWKVKAEWPGNDTHLAAEKEKEFEVIKVAPEITWDEGNPTELEITDRETISISGRLKPNPGAVEVVLSVTDPDGSSDSEKKETSSLGTFTFVRSIDKVGQWEFVVSWDGDDKYDKTSSYSYTLKVESAIGKAIIMQGGGDKKNNKDWDLFSSLSSYVYNAFKRRKFTDDSIYYLNPERKKDVDVVTSLDDLEYAITKWAPNKLNPKLSLYIYLISHNGSKGLLIDKTDGGEKYLTEGKLDIWLDELEGKCKDITLIIEACYSGDFIETLSQEGRTIITSAQASSEATIWPNYSFTNFFFDRMVENRNVKESFESASKDVEADKLFGDQKPQLEANGDGISNGIDDKVMAESKYIDGNYDSLTRLANPPEIAEVSEDQELPEGTNNATVWALVSAMGTGGRVWGIVVPPDYREAGSEVEYAMPDIGFPTVDFKSTEKNRYEGICEDLDKEGVYKILIYAEDADGTSQPKLARITVPEKRAVEPDDKLTVPWGDVKNAGDELVPSRFALGQNYPNPFNPDTWIPYQLADDTDVVIRIYNSAGQLVRRLELGRRLAGYYLDKDRAAYWDGRNSSGESTASGVYFYRFEAGDFIAVRKLLIVK
jgi:tripartite motif-containing protein 71